MSDIDNVITDANDSPIQSATITLTNSQNDDGETISILGTLPAGITVDSASTTTTLILTGQATLAEYEAALKQVVYNNTDENPNTTPRTIEFTVSDDTGNSNTATTTINISPVNDTPTLDLDADDSSTATGANFTTSFTKGDTNTLLADTDTTITDADNTDIASATITLTNPQGDTGEAISILGPLPSGITLDPSSTATSLILTGSATLAEYETALKQVVYNNTDTVPDTTDRVVSFVVNDGSTGSNIATTTIDILVVNPIAQDDIFIGNADLIPATYYEYFLSSNIRSWEEGQAIIPIGLRGYINSAGDQINPGDPTGTGSFAKTVDAYIAGFDNRVGNSGLIQTAKAANSVHIVVGKFSVTEENDYIISTVANDNARLMIDYNGDGDFLDTIPLVGGGTTNEYNVMPDTIFNDDHRVSSGTIHFTEQTYDFNFTVTNGGGGLNGSFSFKYATTPGNNFTILDISPQPFVLGELSGSFSVNGYVLNDNGNGVDSHPTNNTLTVTEINGNSADINNLITLPSGAQVTLNSNGYFAYDTNGLDLETDSFTYTITDSGGGTDSATVTLNNPNSTTTPAVWENVNLMLTSNYNLTSTINSWNSSASSIQQITDDGFVETVVAETNTNRMFGLSADVTTPSYTDIDFAIQLVNNGTLRVYENGAYRGAFGTYSSGDIIRVESFNDEVTYQVNGVTRYTSTITPSDTLIVDTSIHTQGGTLQDIIISDNVIAPIVIDLDGDGFNYINIYESNAYYDVDNDNTSERTAWFEPDDGILVLDIGEDKVISDRDEISFINYVENAKTDLEGLKHFDTNQDGLLSEQDDQFDDFYIWQDADSDGTSDEGELLSLKELKIEYIDLLNTEEIEAWSGDVYQHSLGQVHYTDGSTSAFADAAFAYEAELNIAQDIEQASAF